MRTTNLLLSLALSVTAGAQSLAPQVTSTSGASAISGSVQLAWTVGEIAVVPLQSGSNILTQGFHQGDPLRLRLSMRAFLRGPYSTISGSMSDGLRVNGLVPLTEPYTALGFALLGGGGETMAPAVLVVTGSEAIIDWVLIELRDGSDNADVLYSRCALVQADGDVVDVDGISPVSLPMPPGTYYIGLHHRNHLAVLTQNAIALSHAIIAVDLTTPGTPTYGTDAQQVVGGVRMLWCGDVTANGMVKYVGSDNDRDPIVVAIGGTIPTNTVSGYLPSDVNMDGTVKYVGQNNDRDMILQTIDPAVPTSFRIEQMP